MTPDADDRLEALAGRIEHFLTGEPHFFVEVVALTGEGEYRDLLRAWGLVRRRCPLERAEEGRYVIAPSSATKGERR
jgi:hypothetical protein